MKMQYLSKAFACLSVIIAVAGATNHSESENFERFESIFDFTDGLKNESVNIVEYAKKIQALFCPGQPICTTEGDMNSTDTLKTLPEIVGVGMEAVQLEDLYKVVGACCLPCSCDTKTCKENGNCCLSKIFADAIDNNPDIDDQTALDMIGSQDVFSEIQEGKNTTTVSVYGECIKASWLSYRDKDDLETADDLDIPGYFMITQCFENNVGDEDMIKCQNPSESQNEVMSPVISSDTGRIYWNLYCARCNNDDGDISWWVTSVKFNTDITYFVNNSDDSVAYYPDTYTDMVKFISQTGNVLYTPPTSQDDKLCLRKNALYTCMDSKHVWLKEACERIYSPLIIENSLGYRIPFRNIFCYLCRHQYMKPSSSTQCGFTDSHTKMTFKGMSALLDYRAHDSSHNAISTTPAQDACRCDEVYDRYLHFCRRVYCPAGDFMANCHCVQPFKQVFGMPVLLTIKLIPASGRLHTLTTDQIAKSHMTLKKLLHTISENISIDFIGLLKCKADAGDYYLSLVVVRSLPGYDTKEMIHPFLEYLDDEERKIGMVIKRTTYSVRITSRIRLWTWKTLANEIHYFRDLESTVKSYTVLFDNNDLHKVYGQKFQILTPLLYCMQVRLNDTEFKELDGRLSTLHTPKKIILSYYRRISNTTVQVCADQYMEKRVKNNGITICLSKNFLYMYIILMFGCMALLVSF